MRLWIDLDNSPHVLFFAPIIRELQRQGLDVFLTVREFSQTCGLAEQHGLKFTVVGRHAKSTSFVARVTSTLCRAWELRRLMAKQEITAAVSHGSRGCVLAAWSLKRPIMTMYDYEFVSSGLFNLFSDRVLVPEVIPSERLQAQGLKPSKLVRYPGLKEEVYVYDLKPDPGLAGQLCMDRDKVVVTLRPPATWAHYHDARSEVLLNALIQRLKREPGVQVFVAARTSEQETWLRRAHGLSPPKFQVFSRPVDGLSLMWLSDLVFSGGGTMTREAALLGLNVYSIFAGRLGAADEYLTSRGQLHMIREASDIEAIRFAKRPMPHSGVPTGRSLAPFMAQEIMRFAEECGQ